MTEIVWAPIPSQQGYEASSLGDIRRSETGKVYSQSVSSEGYLSIAIYADGKRKWRRAHRLVAEAFLGPADGREVNHKNGIKTDNRIENLEWCTKSENIRHRFYVLGKGIKEIVAIAECGCTKSFPSIEEAGRQGFHTGRIYECLNGIAETHKGYRWCRPEDVPTPSMDAAEFYLCEREHVDNEDRPLTKLYVGMKIDGKVILTRQCGADAPPSLDAEDVPDSDWRLKGYSYASKQATNCAGCGEHKHTPLRVDWMGGYVCLTCIDKEMRKRDPDEGLHNAVQSACGELPDGWSISLRMENGYGGIELHDENGEDRTSEAVSADQSLAEDIAEAVAFALDAARASEGKGHG